MRPLWWQMLVHVFGCRPAAIEGPENARYGTVVDAYPSRGSVAGLVFEAWWGNPGEPISRQQILVGNGDDIRFGDRVAWDGEAQLWWFPGAGKAGLRLQPILCNPDSPRAGES